ncbi:probable receptor-like protein kinase [Tanacetum coccineum]
MKTPMSSDTKLTKDEECESVDSTKYRGMIGTTHLGLWYPKGTGIETVVYADSDHAGDYVDRKSTSAMVGRVGDLQRWWVGLVVEAMLGSDGGRDEVLGSDGGAAVAGIVAVIAFYFIRRHLHQRRRMMETRLASEGRELRIEYSFLRKIAGLPTKYRYKDLEEATDNWKSVIGKGASACVFKGLLKDGIEVAVKRIQHEEERGDKEFRSEIAAIASVQHVNLVPIARTVGGCLSWNLRSVVALDVAKALAYLHTDCRSRVLHLDVKPENILLDENHRAIVSDFGLSKLMTRDQSRVLTTLRGTKGYLAPEWLLELGVSEKSDVFSYGMVLLEIIGGRRNVTVIDTGCSGDRSKRKFQYFPKIVTEKLKAGRIMEVVDQRLLDHGGIDEKEVTKMVHVALWCIQEKVRRRPKMVEVVKWLEGRVAVDEPPETQMIVVDLLSIEDDDDQDEGQVGNKRKKPKVVARMASQLNGCLTTKE